MQIKYGNNDVTQLVIMHCMNNNIITIPNDIKTRELLFGPSSDTSIKVNDKQYNHDIFIDFTTVKRICFFPPKPSACVT
jgi:hypothetical protein